MVAVAPAEVSEEDWVEAFAVKEVLGRLAALVAQGLVATVWAEVWEECKPEVVARAEVTPPVLALEVSPEVLLAVAPEALEETTAVGSPVTSNN